jgi:hypothetical protein
MVRIEINHSPTTTMVLKYYFIKHYYEKGRYLLCKCKKWHIVPLCNCANIGRTSSDRNTDK